MFLSIDIGNTFIKAASFENEDLKELFLNISKEELLKIVSSMTPEKIIVCSVSGKKEDVLKFFPQSSSVLWLDHTTPLPFRTDYKTPETLGMDRVAASAGAIRLFPKADRLVIDAGTCITFEFIDREDIYRGGSIAPGIEMRFKALNTFTSRLPLVSQKEKFELPGKNTEESIRAGVLKGILSETRGIIQEFKDKYPGIKVILCGGDSSFFETNLKESIFAVPGLVLIGLNSILLYNAAIR